MTDHVSRETPPAPPAAQGVFSHALPSAEAYAHRLATDGQGGIVLGTLLPRHSGAGTD